MAQAAIDRGAAIVNDISALRYDPDLAAVVARARRGAHPDAQPRAVARDVRAADYRDVVDEVRGELDERIAPRPRRGIPRERVIVDPGHRLRQARRAQLARCSRGCPRSRGSAARCSSARRASRFCDARSATRRGRARVGHGRGGHRVGAGRRAHRPRARRAPRWSMSSATADAIRQAASIDRDFQGSPWIPSGLPTRSGGSRSRWWDVVDIVLVSLLIYEVLKLIRGTRAVQMAVGARPHRGAVLPVAGRRARDGELADSQHDRLRRVRGDRDVPVRHPARARASGPRAVLPLPRARARPSTRRSRRWRWRRRCCRRSGPARSSCIERADRPAKLRRGRHPARCADQLRPARDDLPAGSPLHDGAVIIQENRIAAAACFLPLTVNPRLSRDLGTRHRAAIGLTEENDALADRRLGRDGMDLARPRRRISSATSRLTSCGCACASSFVRGGSWKLHRPRQPATR